MSSRHQSTTHNALRSKKWMWKIYSMISMSGVCTWNTCTAVEWNKQPAAGQSAWAGICQKFVWASICCFAFTRWSEGLTWGCNGPWFITVQDEGLRSHRPNQDFNLVKLFGTGILSPLNLLILLELSLSTIMCERTTDIGRQNMHAWLRQDVCEQIIVHIGD